jgi:hypothetical protein
MKKLIVLVAVAMLVFSTLAYAGGKYGPMGPAPNSGDCIPDGSGWFDDDPTFGPGYGPAPNAGDDIPDGSGFETPNGPGNGMGPAPNAGDGVPDGSGF